MSNDQNTPTSGVFIGTTYPGISPFAAMAIGFAAPEEGFQICLPKMTITFNEDMTYYLNHEYKVVKEDDGDMTVYCGPGNVRLPEAVFYAHFTMKEESK